MFNITKPLNNWIISDENPIMKEKSNDVFFPLNEKDIEIISKMISYIDYSYDEKNQKKSDIRPGIGIAAIQLGYLKKIIYIHFNESGIEHKYLLANAKIIAESFNKSFLSNGEGCLSVKKDVKGFSIRKANIIVQAIDLFENKNIEIKAKGMLAICLQHEIDHTNGLFYYDRINLKNPFYKEKDWYEI